MQYLCMGFEIVRAAGVVNTEYVLFYRKIEPSSDRYIVQWLGANAYLHGLQDIKAGDTMTKARTILNDRYGLK